MKNFQSDFQDIFKQTYNSVGKNAQIATLIESQHLLKAGMESRDVSVPSTDIVPQYLLQERIRPIFGKNGINESTIGTHPDFIELENLNEKGKEHYICTIFIDLKSSTRLALLYDLNEVYKLKNAFLKTCIDTVRAFDGHVHRLMGDALMGFFGGSNIEKEDAIADAINCATTLHLLFKEAIIPWMEQQNFDTTKIGFRIGLDFGNDNNVLWAAYGYDSANEVTATGLQVDMAAKLQGHAKTNHAMLGQTLLDFIDFPEEYSFSKTKREGELTKTISYVEPNITRKDGTPLNYKMKMLHFDKLLRLSPLTSKYEIQSLNSIGIIKDSNINYICYYIDKNDGSEKEYISMSKFLPKGMSLKFKITVRTCGMRYNYPLTVLFTKTNYGKEADKNGQAGEFTPTIKVIRQNNSKTHNEITASAKKTIDEATQYRGLHTMEAKIIDSKNSIIFHDWIGILIV